jgi:RNA polymerase sigma factor (TIGR02999 family)
LEAPPKEHGFVAMSDEAMKSESAGHSDVTRVLERAQRGEPSAAAELLPLVYDELRRLAAAKMGRERPNQTLQPTALVHEAWLRLVGDENQQWNGRAHFFGAAAEAMRRILVENARRKGAARHGGGQVRLDIQEIEIGAPGIEDELLAVHEALDRLAARDKMKAELVKLRYFAGLTTEEAAQALGISVPTADRWWNYSRAWLFEEIERQRKG